MSNLYFFSGPCGCGKSTLADAWAKHLVNNAGRKQVYVIHGDDFHEGFVEPDAKGDFFVDGLPGDAMAWEQILASTGTVSLTWRTRRFPVAWTW